MDLRLPIADCRLSRDPRRAHGFSFPEVLFAVAVLGIGFIMVAAIFPVAIMQTQATMEETVGTAVTRNGISYMRGSPAMTSARLPYTTQKDMPDPPAPAPPNPGQVFSFLDPRIDVSQPPNAGVPVAPPAPAIPPKAKPDELWNAVKANLIDTTDPRFAFVPVYVRDNGSNFAKVIVIGVRIRTRDQFRARVPNGSTDIPDTERRGPDICAELEPRPVKVQLIDGGTQPDRAIIEVLDVGASPELKDLSAQSNAPEAAVDGAYLIISNDGKPDDNGVNTKFQNEHGLLNGRVYRLGPETNTPAPPSGGRQFELAIGGDMAGPSENVTDAIAFIVGRGYSGPTGNSYSGPSMAVQHYENVIPLP